ncbi:ZZ-type zinc finger-containing protein 3 isoform X2 [Latimeria chalumnae]|uniref:ZZ-type zinc finger-containing protein 3 isoform X2 n=1 Tax=Latimeria chalumnae TaxID=7897 RepID=UPI0003C13B30|nr:PREDICTED: ZZ-type zinc finger-containing protein 3 isoform X2 [Latimeria chalumnae]|eukprot:XP_005998983.1 PREDICTED: ZZ-type zinc finger-containing protein 3 isoform X2 [Latimeria chalumnae]
MAASRSTRVTRSSVGLNGLDENFCGRTLRNRSIAHPEESSPLSQLRSRSPKKKQESIQQKGGNSGRAGDLKQQNARELWVSPRKRGLFTSEKESVERQAATENCEKRLTEPVSPVVKRIKRCSHSEAPNSLEELPFKNEKELIERRSSATSNDVDSPGLKRARRCLVLDDCDKEKVKKVNDCEEGFSSSLFAEDVTDHQAVNGIDEKDSAAQNCVDYQPEGNTKKDSIGSCMSAEQAGTENGGLSDCSSTLLNGKKADPVSEPDVPCINAHKQAESEDYRTAENCLPDLNNDQSTQPATVSSVEIQSSIRESEEEVDVVGDSGSSSKDQCIESANGNLNAANENTQFSGEPEPLSGLSPTVTQVTSFSEPQEHRYTLRTSPRRAASTKSSPFKINSPCRDSEQAEDKKSSPNERNVDANTSTSQNLVVQPEEEYQTERNVLHDSGDCPVDGVTKPTSESGLVNEYLSSAKENASLPGVEEEDDDPDVYYFESDHVALKHNKDYQRLLQTIGVLEAQRKQAIQDLEALGRHQRAALKDPITFVEKLQKKVDVGLPCPQRVVQLPEIAWEQYTSSLGNFEREFRNKKRTTRRLKLIFDKGLPVRPKSPLDFKKDGESSLYSVLPSSDAPESTSSNSRPQMIRGRICDETKPETFNQLWTIEEQKKLEQLLLKYPPEEVESRRWQKIADELGNRTAKQVASRVQKYFIKLTKAGIPVPGRTPNLYMYSKKNSNRRQHPLNKHLFKRSTFMTSHEPPVFMDEEDDDRSSWYSGHMDIAAEDEISDDESIPAACRQLPEYKELLQLKKMKKQKLQQMQAESGFVQHIGFKCDNCGTEPIQGVRWHCQDCPQEASVDFCDGCSDCLHETETHKADHQLEPMYRAETFLDRDYCMSQSTGYNYLDPNYFPANR